MIELIMLLVKMMWTHKRTCRVGDGMSCRVGVEAIATTHLRVPSIEQQDLCEPSIIIY